MMKWKKLIAAIMAATMAIVLCMPAMAASVDEAIIDTSAKGSITIYKYDETSAREDKVFNDSYVATGEQNADAENLYADYAIEGVEFTYLKIADIATYSTVVDSAGNASVQLVYGVSSNSYNVFASLGLDVAQAIKVDTTAGIYYFTSDALIDFLAKANEQTPVATKNALENFVKTNSGTAMALTDAKGKTSAKELNVGLYLIVETAVPENVTTTTAPFLVSIPMTDLVGDNWIYDVTVYPKNLTGKPVIKKEVAEVTSARVPGEYSTAVSSSMGDTVAYRITSTLPMISSEATYLTEYTFTDVLDAGISYVQNDITLTWFDESGNEMAKWSELNRYFRVSYTGNQMTVTMTEAGLSHINPAYSGYTLVIDYTATVDSNGEVVLGDEGNGNAVTLKWRRTSMNYSDTMTAGNEYNTADGRIQAPAVYTYGIELTKLFSDANGDASAVKFVLYNQTDGYYLTANKAADGLYYVTGKVNSTKEEATVFSPAADGVLNIYGLEADVYIATELETDDGYTLLKNHIQICLNADRHERVCSAEMCSHDKHGFLTASATVNGNAVTMEKRGESVNAVAPLTVINERGYEVPATGDSGTFFLPMIGILGACCLAIATFSMKKENA